MARKIGEVRQESEAKKKILGRNMVCPQGICNTEKALEEDCMEEEEIKLYRR